MRWPAAHHTDPLRDRIAMTTLSSSDLQAADNGSKG